MGRASRSKAVRRSGGPTPVLSCGDFPTCADRLGVMTMALETQGSGLVRVFVPCPRCSAAFPSPALAFELPQVEHCGTCGGDGWVYDHSHGL